MQKGSLSGYTEEHKGRVLLLLLLFAMGLYSFKTYGITGLTMVFGAVPAMLLVGYFVFKRQMLSFWGLFVVNFLVMFLNREGFIPLPVSLVIEALELALLALGVLDAKIMRFEKVANVMGLALLIWVIYCTLEVLNNSCDLGIDVGNWYKGARLMSFQLFLGFVVCSIYIETAERLNTFLRLWAVLAIFASLWCLKQQYIGFDQAERIFLVTAARTHMVNGITRYFSIFTDAANFGINMAATATLFLILALSTRIKRDRILFLITGLLCVKSMFASGTRTAIFCLMAGLLVYVVLSKSFKLAVPVIVIGGLFVGMLMFTEIGQGNPQIRRMRSAFNKDDASAGARKYNQAVMAKYLQDAPWGMGIGIDVTDVPPNNKFYKLSMIPPDSEYVFIWVHTGVIGITVFVITTLMMWSGACCVVLFRLKNRTLIGIGGGLCSAFVAMQLGGYGNQVLMQFPNVLLFYGGLSLVYVLPRIEKEFVAIEDKRFAEQEERKRLKEEKKKAKRV